MRLLLPAGDAFSPNPGDKDPQGPFGVCPSTTGPFTAANPFYGCDSKGECGEAPNPSRIPALRPAAQLLGKAGRPEGMRHDCSLSFCADLFGRAADKGHESGRMRRPPNTASVTRGAEAAWQPASF